MLLFCFHGTEFRVVFSSEEGFGMEFREVSVSRNSLNSIENNHLFWLFCLPRNYFLSEILNPNPDQDLDTDPDPVPNQGFLGLAIFISNIRREHYFFLFFFFLYTIQNILHSATAKLVQKVIVAGGMGEKNRKCISVQSFRKLK
jgi:hypothetical protein